jgi:hypothetical protein
MGKVSRSIKLFAVEHANAKNLRVALVLLTLATLVISAGAPAGCSEGG